MSSRRHQRRKACEGKVGYMAKDMAYRSARVLRRLMSERNISVYHCRFCGQFHVGHHALRYPA